MADGRGPYRLGVGAPRLWVWPAGDGEAVTTIEWTAADIQVNADALMPAPRLTEFMRARLIRAKEEALKPDANAAVLMRRVAEIACAVGAETLTHDPQDERDPVIVNVREYLQAEDAEDTAAYWRRQARNTERTAT